MRRGKRAEATQALELAHLHGSPEDAATARASLGFLDVEDEAETPDAAGEAQLTAADVARLLGDPDAERAHLVAARRAFAVKGNVVREREVAARLG